MKRGLRAPARFLFCALALIAIVAAAAWLLLRASLPRVEGELTVRGIERATTIARDALGTVTIRADSRRDAAWSLGFVHAQERYFGMDLLRRRAAGELAELFGKAALPLDRDSRAQRMRARMSQVYRQLPSAQRTLIDAYRDGVNTGLDDLSVRPFEYVLLRSKPAAWRSEDTLLVVAAMSFMLNGEQGKRELALSRMRAALPSAAHAFLAGRGGELDAPLLGSALAWPQVPGAGEFDLRSQRTTGSRADSHRHTETIGSNAFAVGGALTGGGALVANDMHLDLRAPNLWFRTRLVYPDPADPAREVDVSGVSLPGAPSVIAGSNGHIAWGFTNSYIDVADWVRVERDPHDRLRYRTGGGWERILVTHETIKVAGDTDATLTVEQTRWGPILAQDVDGAPLALAWSASQPDGIDVGIGAMETTRTLEDALALAHRIGIPPQNFIVGDRQGHIAWTIAGRIPRRIGDFDPSLPADWSRANTGWDGWLAGDAHPQIIDPPGARLWSANQRSVDGDLLKRLGDGGYDLGARAGQIRDDLAARPHFTPDDMLAIQLDDRAVLLARWKAQLDSTLAAAPATPLRKQLQRALADWNGHAAIDSVAYRVVHDWRNEVSDGIVDAFTQPVRARFADFEAPSLPQVEQAVWQLLKDRPAHLVPAGAQDWARYLLDCADRIATRLDQLPGGIGARTWGEANTTQINHPLSRALPSWLARWLDMPHEPLPGDRNMPRVQAPGFGASERFAVSPGDEAHGHFMMPGGQSGHPLSPWYGAGHEDWASGRPTPFLPGPAQTVLHLLPAH